MTYNNGPRIVTDGLVLCLDAANRESYPGSGTTWYDLSGNDKHGTLVNGPTFSSQNGGAIVYDQTNDYSYSSSLSLINLNMTIEVVFKVNAGAGTWRDIAVLDAGSSNTIILEIGGNNGSTYTNGYLRYYGYNLGLTSNDLASANQYIFDYKIHYAALTIDYTNSIGSSYFDGNLEGTSTFTGSSITYSRLTLANDLTRSGRHSKSNIYQAKLYNRALTIDEIKENYNATRGRYGL